MRFFFSFSFFWLTTVDDSTRIISETIIVFFFFFFLQCPQSISKYIDMPKTFDDNNLQDKGKKKKKAVKLFVKSVEYCIEEKKQKWKKKWRKRRTILYILEVVQFSFACWPSRKQKIKIKNFKVRWRITVKVP